MNFIKFCRERIFFREREYFVYIFLPCFPSSTMVKKIHLNHQIDWINETPTSLAKVCCRYGCAAAVIFKLVANAIHPSLLSVNCWQSETWAPRGEDLSSHSPVRALMRVSYDKFRWIFTLSNVHQREEKKKAKHTRLCTNFLITVNVKSLHLFWISFLSRNRNRYRACDVAINFIIEILPPPLLHPHRSREL